MRNDSLNKAWTKQFKARAWRNSGSHWQPYKPTGDSGFQLMAHQWERPYTNIWVLNFDAAMEGQVQAPIWLHMQVLHWVLAAYRRPQTFGPAFNLKDCILYKWQGLKMLHRLHVEFVQEKN